MKMVRSSLAAAMLLVLLPPMSGSALGAEVAASCIPADQCCRFCDDGKACGNSCINRRLSCHKGRGCACNVDEVCP